MFRSVAVWAAVLSPGLAWAQIRQDGDQAPRPNPSSGANLLPPYNPLARPELWLSVACIAFGLVVLLAQFLLLRKVERFTADDIVRNSTITIVVIGALILIIAGYDSQQTAQAFGLFGTIVGYLLGQSSQAGKRPSPGGAGPPPEPSRAGPPAQRASDGKAAP